MKLLATTTRSIQLIDTHTDRRRLLSEGEGAYYGIACGDDRIFVAARGRMPSSGHPIHDEAGHILVFDRHLTIQARIRPPFPLRDMHQIAWHDGKLWITNTYFNAVAILSREGRWQQWHPKLPPLRWRMKQVICRKLMRHRPERPLDYHHYNSIVFVDDNVGLLAHNLGRGPSELHLFDLRTLRHVDTQPFGMQAHGVWYENAQFWTCSSGEGVVVDQRCQARVNVGGFPRGYASDGRIRAVGITARVARPLRDHADAAIRMFDRGWQHLRDVPLPRQGMLADIALLPDFAIA